MEVGEIQRIVHGIITESHFLQLDAILCTDICPEGPVKGQAGIFILADIRSDEGRIYIHHRQVKDGRQLHDIERRTALFLQLPVQSRYLLPEISDLLLKFLPLAFRTAKVLAAVLDERLPYEKTYKAYQEPSHV